MKAVVKVGWKDYVMDADKAITLLGMLEGAEVFESKWVDKTNAYYIYPQDTEVGLREVRLIPDQLYKMAKLAGKPVNK
jgi:hypothetical protein